MADSKAGIGSPETVDITELNNYINNPRIGNVEQIAASLATNGQYKPIVVNRGTHTGRSMEVLAGNHTLKALRLLSEQNPMDSRWRRVDCWVVDVDEDRAAKIVLADNRTADIGSYDNEALLELLQTIDDDLDGTGYSKEDLDILKDIAGPVDSLDDLADEFGEPEDDDFWVTVRFRIPPVLNEQWVEWSRTYDSPEEAFEALLDKGGEYGQT